MSIIWWSPISTASSGISTLGDDENVAGSRPTDLMSACRVMTQNPSAPGSGCQCTGEFSRSHVNWSCGCP